MNIYVAGSSREHELVFSYIEELRKMGHSITHDWTESIRVHGPSNDAHVPREFQKYYAECDLTGIENASLVWFVCPDAETKGMWTELGYTLAIKRIVSRIKKMIVIASGNTKQCIFLAGIDEHFQTHDMALDYVRQCR